MQPDASPESGQESGQESGSALRYHNFALLWVGQTVSIAGNGIFTVALPLEVFRFTNSSLDLAIVLSVGTVPLVTFLLIGGAIVDRLSRRLIMLVSDTVSGLAVSLVTILIATGRVRFWELVLLSLIFGASLAFFLPASTAIFRDILPASLMVNANSLTSLSQSLVQYLAGPLIGGVIVAVLGTAWAFGVDGASFMISVVCLAAMSHITPRKEERSPILPEIRAGLRYSRSQAWLWWSMIAMGIANLVCFVPVFVLEPILVRHVFKTEALALGIIYATNGAGGALASLYVRRRGAPRKRIGAIWAALVGAGISTLFLGLSPSIWMAAFFAGTLWGGATYGNILWLAMLQEEVPAELLGRVASLDWMLSLALSPLGMIAGGAAAGAVGVRMTLILSGALAACTGGVILVPKVREPDRRRAVPVADPGTQVADPIKG